jgi:hypothetical protein
MYQIKLIGTLTSKRAFDVPVIRNWKLVLERREFGTKIDKIDETINLHFLDWAEIPTGGIKVKLKGDIGIKVKRDLDPDRVVVGLTYKGIDIPTTQKTYTLPFASGADFRLLSINTEIWKGVNLDVKGRLVFSL